MIGLVRITALSVAVTLSGAVSANDRQYTDTYAPQEYVSDVNSIFYNGFEKCPTTIQTSTGPRTLLRTAWISYGVYPAQRPHVDITTWDGLWGYNNAYSPVVPWPGAGGAAPVIRAFPKSGYTCSVFRTPTNIAAFNGGFTNPSYVNGPNVTMAISRVGGDFSQQLPTRGCLHENVATSDANLVQWKGTPNAPDYFCNLQPNTTYYVNVMLADPAQCAAQNCVLGTVSVHN